MCSIHGLNILQGPSQILRVLTQVAIRYSIALWLPHTHTLTHHTHIHANTQIHHTHIQKYIYTHKSTHIYTHKYTTTHIHIPHMPQTTHIHTLHMYTVSPTCTPYIYTHTPLQGSPLTGKAGWINLGGTRHPSGQVPSLRSAGSLGVPPFLADKDTGLGYRVARVSK